MSETSKTDIQTDSKPNIKTLSNLKPSDFETQSSILHSNNKFDKFLLVIQTFTQRIKTAKEELEKSCAITSDLQIQCEIQARECNVLEDEQKNAKNDVNNLIRQLENLTAEKIKIEQALDEMKMENSRLVLLFSKFYFYFTLNYI